MKLDHGNLRALAAVVREGSFERAALSLSVTPSAVSQRIKALEDRMGACSSSEPCRRPLRRTARCWCNWRNRRRSWNTMH